VHASSTKKSRDCGIFLLKRATKQSFVGTPGEILFLSRDCGIFLLKRATKPSFVGTPRACPAIAGFIVEEGGDAKASSATWAQMRIRASLKGEALSLFFGATLELRQERKSAGRGRESLSLISWKVDRARSLI
jgi:hypothetical protein